MKEQLQQQREFYKSGKTLDLDWRMEQLKTLKKVLKQNEPALLEALQLDLGKPEFEAYVTEMAIIYEEVNTAIKNLYRWAEIRSAELHLVQYPGRVHIHREPLGLVLIIAPWNYPAQLVFAPLVAAIAAGNTVAIKPSELSVHTSAVVKRMITETFPSEYITVFEGDSKVAQNLLAEDFDHIFFTGSTRVGKEVMRAAAEHLTSVTLELGGKSPCIVDETADLVAAARRIMWGKCLNCGQTCIAPDYVLVDRKVKGELLKEMHRAQEAFYPQGALSSEDYGQIINDVHFNRLLAYLEQGEIVFGGSYDAKRLKIEPTVLDNVDIDSEIMQEEIFGPILPVIAYDGLEAAMQFVHRRPKPLALYLFTREPEAEQKILHGLSFGGGCVNDTVLHGMGSDLPFGGVGASGMGAYHGKTGFKTFSHEKVILHQSNELALPVRYAPYKKKLKLVRSVLR